MRYLWNSNAARYYDQRTGRFISRDRVRAALDKVIASERRAMVTASERLRDRSIDLGQWQAAMREHIKNVGLAASYAAVGGRGQMTAERNGWVGSYLREQYQYLAGFTAELRRGLPLDGRFLQRTGMYAESARAAFHELQRLVLDDAGYRFERSILHPAEHCAECVDQASLGKVPLGTCIPVGQRQCLGNCHCTMRYYP